MNMNKYLDIKPEVAEALAAGSITIETPETISPVMSAELLRERMDTSRN